MLAVCPVEEGADDYIGVLLFRGSVVDFVEAAFDAVLIDFEERGMAELEMAMQDARVVDVCARLPLGGDLSKVFFNASMNRAGNPGGYLV